MQIMILIMKWTVLFFSLFAAYGAEAQRAGKKSIGEDTVQGRLVEQNIMLSKKIDSLAQSIDVFLTGSKVSDKINTSSITVGTFGSYAEGKGFESSVDFNVNLRLPNLEKKWALAFSSYDEEEKRGIRNTALRRDAREKNYGTSFAFFRKLGNISTTFQPRLQLQDPLQMSYILKMESEAVSKRVRFKPKLELFADPRKGTGEFLSFEHNFYLSRRFSITVVNEEEYQDYRNYFLTSHMISLGQRIIRSGGFSYSVAAGLNNHTQYHLDQYTFSVSWGHQWYKNICHYSIGPYIDFNKAANFKGQTGVTLNMDFIF